MPDPPFTITGKDPEARLSQVTLMFMHLFQDYLAGLKIGDVFSGDVNDILTLDLSSTGGLAKVSNTLSTLLNDAGGIEKDADGLAIKLASGSGLSLSSSGLTITSGGGFGAPTEKTLDTNGEITVSGTVSHRFHTIDTFADAATDSLIKINGGNVGEMLMLEVENNARNVLCVYNEFLLIGYNIQLTTTDHKLLLVCRSANYWHRLSGA